ncbi:transcriptional regulator of NAD metabolism [Caldalkalibacillus uzonensis]|uniref:Transcriptional regulator of NAD metabolism n=2 Tax=Caldalkalibacillus uzonensis TaxID=353224 RepID=A0ABU0CUV2_9BACI|nr:transcriptional regulator of NAD metabolism [Caldalkalibacillus uzonensis]
MSKLLGDKRRHYLLELLKSKKKPLTGTFLAEETGVSRQVIVQDIALLKAKNEPIVATPQGYLYLSSPSPQPKRRVIACQHAFEQTERELTILVEHGVKVVDVIVEHPIYGQIQGSLMVESKKDVHDFLRKVQDNQAKLLSSLTEGVHLHTVEANDDKRIDEACQALEAEGILLKRD